VSTIRVCRWVAWIALASYVVILLTMTHLPRPPGVLEGRNDKTLHFLAYFVLGCCAYFATAVTLPDRKWIGVWLLISGSLFALIDETTQPFFKRHADVFDWIADIIGLSAAMIVAMTIHWGLTRIGKRRA
jgi:VanZ family protein